MENEDTFRRFRMILSFGKIRRGFFKDFAGPCAQILGWIYEDSAAILKKKKSKCIIKIILANLQKKKIEKLRKIGGNCWRKVE